MRWVGCLAAVAVGLLAYLPPDSDGGHPVACERGRPNGGGAFDPDKRVAEIWLAKVVPYFEKKAGIFSKSATLPPNRWTTPALEFGYRAKSENTPWTLMVKFDGVIVAADTESRASTISVDATGKGKTDAIVQIGPAMRRTAIRDALDFVVVRRFHQSDRLRPLRQSVQHLCQSDDARETAPRGLGRAESDGAARRPVRIRRRDPFRYAC